MSLSKSFGIPIVAFADNGVVDICFTGKDDIIRAPIDDVPMIIKASTTISNDTTITQVKEEKGGIERDKSSSALNTSNSTDTNTNSTKVTIDGIIIIDTAGKSTSNAKDKDRKTKLDKVLVLIILIMILLVIQMLILLMLLILILIMILILLLLLLLLLLLGSLSKEDGIVSSRTKQTFLLALP